VVSSYESLVDHNPARILCPLNEEIGQCRDGYIGFVGAVKKIIKMFFLRSYNFLRSSFTDSFGETLSSQTMSSSQNTIIYGLPCGRHPEVDDPSLLKK